MAPVLKQPVPEQTQIQEAPEDAKRADTDVETNMGNYSPLISSASEDEFREAINSEGSFMRERVNKAYKRKRKNRMTFSVFEFKPFNLFGETSEKRNQDSNSEESESQQDLDEREKIYTENIPKT